MDRIVEEGHSQETYIVQEKVHGANFSFWITDTEIKCAKRSGFIEKEEKFYNYQVVRDHHITDIRAMYDGLKKSLPEINEIIVYGELYGGNYNHPDVQKSNESAVQKGVQYSPMQDFLAFDLKINGIFQPYDQAAKIFRYYTIPYIKALFRGSLEECLKYPNEFQTTIPKEAGLPDIEGNMCEGVVIRPVHTLFIFSGERLILKNKNESFTEKHGGLRNIKTPREVKPLSPDAQTALDKVSEYINENRLRNVVSKIGTVSKQDFSKIVGLLTKDIMEDFLKDEQELYDILGKGDRKLVTKKVGQSAALLLRKNFVNIVDEEF